MQWWSKLSEAERVGLYTRQSLYTVLWGYSAFTLSAAAGTLEGGRRTALVVGGLAFTAVAFACLVAALRRYPHPPPGVFVVALLAAAAGYAAVAVSAWEDDARDAALAVTIGCVALVLGLRPDRWTAAGLLVMGALLFAVGVGEWSGAFAGLLIAGALLFTARASMWLLGIVTELDDARQAQVQLSVAEERLRFSRDVHDVLGRRLSTIAVQAELAATLADRGDERAAERMLEVRAIAHDTLRVARELARGYRAIDCGQELDGARSLLTSAGIDVRLSVDAMPRAWHEAAGWVVRESVTNILRHSRAATVGITYGDGRLRIDNDGALPDDDGDGSGLSGLRERLAPLGATLAAGPDGDGRWAIVAELPGTGPLSAR